MAGRIPSRYGISLPKFIQDELSETSQASKCFVLRRFSRTLQEFMVDVSLTTGASPIIQTDSPTTAFWKKEDYLDESIKVSNTTEASKQADQDLLQKQGIIGSGIPLDNATQTSSEPINIETTPGGATLGPIEVSRTQSL